MSRYHRTASTGYNSRAARAYWAPRLPQPCSRCGGVVDGSEPWDVDHLVEISRGGEGGLENTHPAHRACNRRAGQALGAAQYRARRAADEKMLGL